MGLYDSIKCSAALPGTPPEFTTKPGHQFQTKSLGCDLTAYEITANGRLVDFEGKPVNNGCFTGEINFYDGNSRGCVVGATFTANGEDAEWVEYRAVFHDGSLISITEVERTREPALPESARRRNADTRTEQDDALCEARQRESLYGRTMFLCYGGFDVSEGHTVTVVYDGPKEWAVQHGPGDPERPRYTDNKLEVISRHMRDGLLWDSREDAQEARDARKMETESEAEYYVRLLAERARAKGATA